MLMYFCTTCMCVDVGSLFVFEMFCLMLGRLFEPYVVHLLPHLLLCFGDNNQYVREVSTSPTHCQCSIVSVGLSVCPFVCHTTVLCQKRENT